MADYLGRKAVPESEAKPKVRLMDLLKRKPKPRRKIKIVN